MSRRVVVLGGGLAGLGCAYELARAGVEVTVLEREPYPGGMASSFTDRFEGESWTYDFGPHRFHSADPELLQHVRTVLAGNHLTAQRLSRIALGGHFYDYPLSAENVLRQLPPVLLVRAFADYAKVRVTETLRITQLSDDNFQGWVTKRFGQTLYDLFFGRYTAKTWKMSPAEISGDWASQRISLLSLTDAVREALPGWGMGRRRRGSDTSPRGLVRSFLYPAHGGIGEIARGYVREIERLGGQVICGAPVKRVHVEAERVSAVDYGGSDGISVSVSADEYISTIPVTVLARMLAPAAPAEVLAAAGRLRHVSIIFIYLRLGRATVSPDSWMYIPEPEQTIHRISEFKNFSPHTAPADKTMVCAEITCRLGDEHWRAADGELIATATADLQSLGLIEATDLLGGFVTRIPHAYPIYDLTYKENLAPVLAHIHTLGNLRTGGRQGLFRYNNMDQSITMGRHMAAAVLAGEAGAHESIATGAEYFG
jgi:protoporphyrinogen oxidase